MTSSISCQMNLLAIIDLSLFWPLYLCKILYFSSGTLQKSHPEQNPCFCLLPSDMLLCIHMKNGVTTVQIPLKGLLLNGFFLTMEYQNLER